MRKLLTILPYLLIIPASVLTAVTTINLWQIKAPAGTGIGILYTTNAGAVVPGKIAGMSVDSQGNITLASALTVPAVAMTKVTASTPNSFPLIAGKTYCFVFRNIPQASGEDFTINAGAVVFNTPSVIDDVVQLLCF